MPILRIIVQMARMWTHQRTGHLSLANGWTWAVVVLATMGATSGCSCSRHRRSYGKSRVPRKTAQSNTVARGYGPEVRKDLRNPGDVKLADFSRITARDKGVTYTVVMDMTPIVYALEIPEDKKKTDHRGKAPPPLSPSLSVMKRAGFLSAAALALKAKQFDDGLVAVVELVLEKGTGSMPAKGEFLKRILDSFVKKGALAAAAIVAASLELRGRKGDVPPSLSKAAEQVLARRTDLQKKALGFYTWSEELKRIYLADKVLQDVMPSAQAARAAEALAADKALAARYGRMLHLAERLTNRFRFPDLRAGIQAATQGKPPTWHEPVALFPPSRSPESDIIEVMYGDRPIPDGFNLMDEIIRRVHSRTLNLRPRQESGWYIWQLHALTALLDVPHQAEGGHLVLDMDYEYRLQALFEALYSLTRESHVKSFVITRGESIGIVRIKREPKSIKLVVPVQLDVEPLVTYYERRAASYRFIRSVLTDAFGAKALGTMRRQTPSGPVDMTLDEELTLMESLFTGAARRARRQLGMPLVENSARAERVLQAWRRHLAEDPDLGKDIRMMVPVHFDPQRKKYRVWVVLGLVPGRLDIHYETRPSVTAVFDPKGAKVPLDRVDFSFARKEVEVPYPVFMELWVSNLLNRQEFRKLCDRYKTGREILAHLK